MWKIVGASAIGGSHVALSQQCQDHHAYSQRGGLVVAAVCDGAGSAARGGDGSKLGCEFLVRELIATFAADLQQYPAEPAGFRAIIEKKIEDLREFLIAQPLSNGEDISAFHSTLVGMVYRPEGGVFFHIGDGAAVALAQDRTCTMAFSGAENGEFSDQTFFYTMVDWRDHLRITRIPAYAGCFLLMSDGTMPFCLNSNQADIEPRFFRPLNEYLSREDITTEAGAEALMGTLSSDRANSISNDDKTLVWISSKVPTTSA